MTAKKRTKVVFEDDILVKTDSIAWEKRVYRSDIVNAALKEYIQNYEIEKIV